MGGAHAVAGGAGARWPWGAADECAGHAAKKWNVEFCWASGAVTSVLDIKRKVMFVLVGYMPCSLSCAHVACEHDIGTHANPTPRNIPFQLLLPAFGIVVEHAPQCLHAPSGCAHGAAISREGRVCARQRPDPITKVRYIYRSSDAHLAPPPARSFT